MTKIGLFDSNKLLGENIVEHLRAIQDAKSLVKDYYYSASKLWKAVQKYLMGLQAVKDRMLCPLFDWPGNASIIHCYSCSYGISFRSASVDLDKEFITYNCDIDFDTSEDYAEFHDCHGNPLISSNFDLIFPCELEINFSQKSFNEYIKTKEHDKKEVLRQKDMKDLKRLKKILGVK